MTPAAVYDRMAALGCEFDVDHCCLETGLPVRSRWPGGPPAGAMYDLALRCVSPLLPADHPDADELSKLTATWAGDPGLREAMFFRHLEVTRP
jgi:hypothetical protein